MNFLNTIKLISPRRLVSYKYSLIVVKKKFIQEMLGFDQSSCSTKVRNIFFAIDRGVRTEKLASR